MKVYDDYLRWLYRGGRPSWFARLQNRVSAVAFAAGIWPARVGALDVRGRRSGRVISFPVVIPIARTAPMEDFERIAPAVPIFHITITEPTDEPGVGQDG